MLSYILPILVFSCLIMGFLLSGILGYLIGIKNKIPTSPVTFNLAIPITMDEIVGMVSNGEEDEDDDSGDWTNRFSGE